MNIEIEKIPKQCPPQDRPESYGWAGNPSIQNLLDAVASIIAEEYIRTARKNPETFEEIPASAGMTKGAGK